jgi:hypothetical protein
MVQHKISFKNQYFRKRQTRYCRGFYNLKIHRKQIGQDSGL